MGKIMLAVLATLSLLTANDTNRNTDWTDDPIPVTVETPEEPAPSGHPDSFYRRRVVKISDGAAGIKVLGERRLASSGGIMMDYTCSGVEFNADCRKRIGFKIKVTDSCSFKVYVDGKLYKNGSEDYFIIEGAEDQVVTGTIVIKVSEGVHNIRLVKVSHYRLALACLTRIVLYGEILPERPKAKERYIEFIGDSLMCGWGIAGNHDGTCLSVDGTLAWPYLATQQLEADYSIFAMSGQGAYYGEPSIQDCYLKTSYQRSKKKYSFKRVPDIVIIDVGTNDYTYKTGEDAFRQAYLNIITMVREKYGQDVKILMTYNIKNDEYGSVLRDIAQQQNITIHKFARSKNEATRYHPSVEESVSYAYEIVELASEMLED